MGWRRMRVEVCINASEHGSVAPVEIQTPGLEGFKPFRMMMQQFYELSDCP